MPDRKKPSRSQIVAQEIAALDGPIATKDFIERVMARWHSNAKNARAGIREILRYDRLGHDVILLDEQTLLPMRLALQGVRFRIPISGEEAQRGVLYQQPGFDHLLPRRVKEGTALLDAQRRTLPARSVTFKEKSRDPLLGAFETDVPAFDMLDWFRENRIRTNDSVLVTILSWDPPRLQLEHEPARLLQRERIAEQDRALADIFWTLVQQTHDEHLWAHVGVPTAYARLPSAREYPGSHWAEVLEHDQRMRVTDMFIMPADYLMPFESLLMPLGAAGVKPKPYTPEQGKQVYRFKAYVPRSKATVAIEVQGKQTLFEFDQEVRDAFYLDTSDHLSEFTVVTPRGKGKKPHETPLGNINPFERTDAGKLRVAALGLAVGARLEYVHDFGDWNRVDLVLESIVPSEHGVRYPRTVGAIPPPPEEDMDADEW